MGHVRHRIDRLDDRGGSGKGFLRIAPVLGHGCGTVEFRQEFGGDDIIVQVRAAALAPRHFQGVAALHGRPGRFGADGYGVAHGNDIKHPAHISGPVGVEGHRLGPEAGRVRQHGHAHARQPRVKAEGRAALNLVLHVQPALQRADEDVIVCIFEGRVRRRLQPGSLGGQVAISEAAAVRMKDLSFPGRACGRIRAPFSGRGPHEHEPRSGPGLAEHVPPVPDAGAAARGLDAPLGILEGFGGQSHPGAHAVPVGIEFVGDDHGDARVRALAQVRLPDPDGYGTVAVDLDKCVGAKGGGRPGGSRRDVHEHDGPGRDGGRQDEEPALDEKASRHIFTHDFSSFIFRAASRMAGMMRGCDPQRQVISSMALAISRSDSPGLPVRTSTARSIMPVWQ